jgi:hypothetical protein
MCVDLSQNQKSEFSEVRCYLRKFALDSYSIDVVCTSVVCTDDRCDKGIHFRHLGLFAQSCVRKSV